MGQLFEGPPFSVRTLIKTKNNDNNHDNNNDNNNDILYFKTDNNFLTTIRIIPISAE